MKLRAQIPLFVLLLTLSYKAHSQNQKEADSLKLLIKTSNNIADSSMAYLLYLVTVKSADTEEKLAYANMLLAKADDIKSAAYSIVAYRQVGLAHRLKGDLKKSFEALFLSASLATEHKKHILLGEAYLEIANTYSSNKDFINTLIYEKKAIEIIRRHGQLEQLAINLLNTGFTYYTLGKLDSALLLYTEAEPIFEKIKLGIGQAYTIGNRALVFWKSKDYARAERDLFKSIAMLEPLSDWLGMADYHVQLGKIYFEQNEIENAISEAQKALSLSKKVNLKEQMRDAFQLLSKLYRTKENYKQALDFQTQYIALRDSIETKEKTKEIANMRTEFEVSLKEKEINILEKRKVLDEAYIFIAVILLVLSILILLYFRQRFLTSKLLVFNERKQTEEKIKKLLTVQETKALSSMAQGRDNERKRLAQELHNHLGSLLATIKVNMNTIEENTTPNLDTINRLVNQACADVRNMSHSLNMGIAENFGLLSALKELAAHIRQSGKMEVEFVTSMQGCHINSEDEIIIYRTVQELVSNILKHANASKLSISLTCLEDENLINIMVQDNGEGFNTSKLQGNIDGLGISSMKQLITNRKGEITFDSSPAKGTTINIDFPITTQTIQAYP